MAVPIPGAAICFGCGMSGITVRLTLGYIAAAAAGLAAVFMMLIGVALYAVPLAFGAMIPIITATVACGWRHGAATSLVLLAGVTVLVDLRVSVGAAIGIIGPAMIYAVLVARAPATSSRKTRRRNAMRWTYIVAPVSTVATVLAVAQDLGGVSWPAVTTWIVALIPLSMVNIWAADRIAAWLTRNRRPPPSLSAGSG
ncbi:MAG TPA: hypothetical protein VMP03_10760 [Methylomirabilota bacterium]|nr:hypothetical protein [Methylomirabilota bacterium]